MYIYFLILRAALSQRLATLECSTRYTKCRFRFRWARKRNYNVEETVLLSARGSLYQLHRNSLRWRKFWKMFALPFVHFCYLSLYLENVGLVHSFTFRDGVAFLPCLCWRQLGRSRAVPDVFKIYRQWWRFCCNLLFRSLKLSLSIQVLFKIPKCFHLQPYR